MKVLIQDKYGWTPAEQLELIPAIINKRCVTCRSWEPGRQIGAMMLRGGKCKVTGREARVDYYCWFWNQFSEEQEESRRKAGLIEEDGSNGKKAE